MSLWEIRVEAGQAFLFHKMCGTAYLITSGRPLSELVDWAMAHDCKDYQ